MAEPQRHAGIVDQTESDAGSGTLDISLCLPCYNGAADLAEGLHAAWVRITDSPEIPIRFVGFLEVT